MAQSSLGLNMRRLNTTQRKCESFLNDQR